MRELIGGRAVGTTTVDDVPDIVAEAGVGLAATLDAEDAIGPTHESGKAVTLLSVNIVPVRGGGIDKLGYPQSSTIALLRPWTPLQVMPDPKPKVYSPKF